MQDVLEHKSTCHRKPDKFSHTLESNEVQSDCSCWNEVCDTALNIKNLHPWITGKFLESPLSKCIGSMIMDGIAYSLYSVLPSWTFWKIYNIINCW